MQVPVNDVGKTHLLIGIPACGRMSTVRWGINLAAQSYPLSMSYNFCILRGAEAGDARNKIVDYAREIKAKLLFFVDDDVFPPQYAVQKLLHSMLNKPKVMAAAGIVYTKSPVPQPLVFEYNGSGPYYNWKKNRPFLLPNPGFISTGCMLLKVEAFDKIEPPFFQTNDYERMTEDTYFCLKLQAAGYDIIGHGGVQCGHYDFRSKRVVVAPEEVTV